jgi:hypothetical protein
MTAMILALGLVLAAESVSPAAPAPAEKAAPAATEKATPAPAPAPPDKPPAYEPTANYTVQPIEGWKVYVHNRLLGEKKDLWEETLKVFRAHLVDINRMVPKPALEKLHTIAIWIEADSQQVKCMCYHPSREWLKGHGFNPDKAGAIELGNPRTFVDWTRHQRAMVLHELAHGYHHHFLGYDNPDIKAAYQRAVESKAYESVLYFDGSKKRAYALNNDQEYFAELTEAWFGTNDFYPFVRAEVIDSDPTMAETLRKVWGK